MKKLTAILILLLLIKAINAQTVGLVLSGGGAKGLAHIGVIKALEENSIPIDYIAGTSMGAIVGALYASGYTTDEMIKLFKSKEFYYWSTGALNENYKFFYNEGINDASILNFEVRVDSSFFKPLLPSNIVPTQQMDLAFLKIFAQANALSKSNFDNLFVPFRCVASDIQNKKQVLFRDGDLGETVRSSMTIPIYFKPLIINGTMLFDGGIYNNFPWKELYNEFKPKYIIGSKVANNTKPPKEEDILLQLENMIVGQTDYYIPDSLGILIETNLKEIGVMDFKKIDYIVNEGYINTKKYLNLIQYKVKVLDSTREERRKQFVSKLPIINIGDLKIVGLNDKQEKYILKTIKRKREILTLQKTEEKYYQIITDEFVKRFYPISKYDSSRKVFDLYVNSSVKKNLDVSIGGNVSSSSINQGFISASYSFFGRTATKLYSNIYFGRLYSSLNFSIKEKFPLRAPISFISSLILNRTDYYRSSNELFFEDVKPSYLIKNEAFANIEFNIPLNKDILVSNSFSFGVTNDKYYQTNSFLRSDTPDKTDFTFINTSFKLEKKTLNKKQYAYRGRNQYLKVNYIYGNEEHTPGSTSTQIDKSNFYKSWYNIKLYNESYHKIFSNNIWLGLLIEANYSNKPFFSNYTSTVLSTNGFNPTPHTKTIFINSLHTDKYLAFGVIPNIRIYNEFFLRVEGYVYQPFKEILKTENNIPIYGDSFKFYKLFGSLSLVLHTAAGPLSFSLNYYPNEVKEYYFIFNYGFIIFNRKGLE